MEHSKICIDFSKKLAICIFGCPKLYLGGKKLMKFFFDFHRGDPYVFPQISSKISRWFLKEFLKKNPKGPPYENRKKISSIFFVQDIAWDIQKCILEVFLKNLYILWNAPHIRLEKFWDTKPLHFLKSFSSHCIFYTELSVIINLINKWLCQQINSLHRHWISFGL